MPTRLTQNYWLDVFYGWIEARNMPAPQNDEALAVVDQLKSAVDVIDREHKRAEAAEARASELAAQLATVNTLAHTRLQKIEYLETSLEACRDMQHNAESRVNELQEWYNESVRRNEASAIGAQILENNLNDALAQLATAQAALEQVTKERDAALAHIELYLEKFDDLSLSDDFVKRWLDNSWIPQSRKLI